MTTPARQVCVGPEFGPDPSTHALRVRTPRPMAWPTSQGPIAASNGLMLDAQGGLWVPQTAQWRWRQQFAATSNLPIGTPGTTWAPGSGNQFEPSPAGGFVWDDIVNPSGIAAAGYRVQMEWEIWLDGSGTGSFGSPGPWLEMWGSYSFAADTVRSIGFDALASCQFGNPVDWNKTVRRTETFTLAAGTSLTPDIRWMAKAVTIPSGSGAPVLRYWRVTLTGLGWLLNPAVIV